VQPFCLRCRADPVWRLSLSAMSRPWPEPLWQ
jgi:hypothetical protein